MKNVNLLLVAACFTAAVFPGLLNAQDTLTPNGLASTRSHNKSIAASDAPNSSSAASTAKAAAITSKALKDFKAKSAGAADEKWFADKEGFVGYFTSDGFTNRVYYNKKGRWISTLKYCSEDKLPQDVRTMVKSTYFDFAITHVKIVEIPGHMVYLVHLESPKEIKIVRVSGEREMDVYQEFTKQ